MESGITTNIFCGDFLRFLQIESILVSQKIPLFSLFLFPFWEIFSFSFYTPTTMITGPDQSIGFQHSGKQIDCNENRQLGTYRNQRATLSIFTLLFTTCFGVLEL